MNSKFLHKPTGKIYSCYNYGLYETNESVLMIWMKVRNGNKPPKYIELRWKEVKEII